MDIYKYLTPVHVVSVFLVITLSQNIVTSTDKVIRKETTCGGNTLQIECPDAHVIIFESANYGRSQTDVCGNNDETDCEYTETLAILHEHCFGSRTCSIDVTPSTFIDPCPGVPKYLEVEYVCVPKNNIFIMCDQYYYRDVLWGYIVSPNYPTFYPDKKKCQSEFDNDIGYGTKMKMIDIEMEARDTKGCYDWLIISEAYDIHDTHDYCGSMLTIKEPTELYMNRMLIKFKTDSMTGYRGFLIAFEITKSTKTLGARARPPAQKEVPKAQAGGLDYQAPKQPDFQAPQPQAKLVLDEDKGWGLPKRLLKSGCTEDTVPLKRYQRVKDLRTGKRATVECIEGYIPEDEDSGLYVCSENTWVGDAGKCIPLDCGSPTQISNGEVVYRTSTVGSEVEYLCHMGYNLIGTRLRKCEVTGKWSAVQPYCSRFGVRSHTLFLEFIAAIMLTLLLLLFRKRIPRLLGFIIIKAKRLKDL